MGIAGNPHYGLVEHDGAGGSRMVPVTVDQQEAIIAEGVPPVLVSAPIPATSVILVDTAELPEVREPHRAPRRQLVVLLDGVLEVETSDGQVERRGPGAVALAADVEGAGHISRVIEAPARFLMIPSSTERSCLS